MTVSNKRLLLAFVCACAAGVLLHFVYQWLPCAVTALISPVKESLWEHVKIILWPYLAAALLLHRRDRTGLRPWLLTCLILVALLLSVGYLYHILLGMVALGFLLPRLFPGPWEGFGWELVAWLVVAVGVAVVLFTFWPPEGPLFADLSVTPAWLKLPC